MLGLVCFCSIGLLPIVNCCKDFGTSLFLVKAYITYQRGYVIQCCNPNQTFLDDLRIKLIDNQSECICIFTTTWSIGSWISSNPPLFSGPTYGGGAWSQGIRLQFQLHQTTSGAQIHTAAVTLLIQHSKSALLWTKSMPSRYYIYGATFSLQKLHRSSGFSI